MKQLIVPALLCVLCLGGCGQEEAPSPYFIFGQYGGCMDDCNEYYKIRDGILYSTPSDSIPANGLPADISMTFIEYTGPVPENIFSLPGQIPSLLYDMEPVIGAPDAAQDGAYYIEIKMDETPLSWRIDKNFANVPQDLYPFLYSISDYLADLQ